MPSIAVLPALALLAGAACGSALDVSATWALWMLPLAAAGAVVAFLVECRAAFVAFAAAAFWWGACGLAADAKQKALDTPLRLALDREFGGFAIDTPGPGGAHDAIRVRGVLAEDAARSDDLMTLRIDVTQITVGGTPHPVAGLVTFSVAGSATSSRGKGPARPATVTEWTAGRTLELMATFRRPARYLDEGVPDFERDLALSGTTLFGSVKSGLLVDVVARGNRVQEAAAQVRQHVRGALNRWIAPLDPLSSAIVAAVLIGDRTGLPDDIRVRLQAAGTYHVIAISGGNIAILAGLSFGLLFVCGFAGRSAAFVTLVLLVAYAAVVTAGASVWRATVMASLYLAARVFDHRSPPWHAMGVAAALVVCAKPLEVRDAGFMLTFGATAALLEAARRLNLGPGFAAPVPRLARDVAAPPLPVGQFDRACATAMSFSSATAPRRWLVASLVASAAAEIVLLPVSASSFSRVTSAGLVLNLIAVPLMSVVQIAGMVVSLMDHVGVVARPAAWSAHLAARGIVWSSQLVDVVPWLTARVPPPPISLVLVYYGGLAASLLCRRLARATAVLVLVASGVAIAAGAQPSGSAVEAGHLRLTVFDVGQGDAALLELPDLSRIQVDTGGIPFGSTGFDIGARVVGPSLWARGIRRIDTLLLTHGDPDHIGGARTLLDDFRPSTLWEGIRVPRHVPMRDLLARAEETGAIAERRIAGEHFESAGVRIRVLHPPPADWERRRVRNDDSVVLEVLYGDVAILLNGDIGADVEREIIPQLTPARIRILKVAHHGSRTSSSAEFLEAWRPQVALISCGRGNSFGHPAPDVIERLTSIGAQIYRTDLDGQITLDTDGTTIATATFVGTRMKQSRGAAEVPQGIYLRGTNWFNRRTEHLMSRALLAIGFLVILGALGPSTHAQGKETAKFKRIPTQFIAALGDSHATSGNGAQSWGLWRQDPGPRGVELERYTALKVAGGVAPAQWKFDNADWWLEEHGLIMEKPDFPLPPGKYMVTGDRETTAALTIYPRDKDGNSRWELADGATLWDVTHLGCRSGRYTPGSRGANACTPASAKQSAFPVAPGGPMPAVEGCNKQDYQVLIVIAVGTDS